MSGAGATIVSLLLVGVTAAIAAGVGARVLRALGLGDAPLAERGPYALAVGLGCVAYGILALGLLHLLWVVPVVVLMGVFAAVGIGPAWALARESVGHLRGARFAWLPAITGGLVALLLLVALVPGLAPPSSDDWDGLSYHLADPALYLQHRGIVYLFWESHSNFPFTIEMLYTLAVMSGAPQAARVFHWLYLVVACMLLAAAWRRLWPDESPRARWLAPLMLAGSPIVLWTAGLAYNDLALLAYNTLAAYGVWAWMRTRRSGWLWASGICLGLALGTKMTALIFAALLTALVAAAGRREKGGARGAAVRVLGWGALALVVAAPWYVKSYVYTNNPVYPFFYGLFPETRYWSDELAAQYQRTQGAFGIGHGWRNLVMAPWDLVTHAERFTDGTVPGFGILRGSLGPAFLALLPAALLLRRRDRVALGMLLFIGGYGLLWFLLSEQTRYLMPVLPVAALLGARGLCGLFAERRLARIPAAAAVAIPVAHCLLIGTVVAGAMLPVVTGAESRDDYLRRTLNFYPMCEYVNATLPPDARLMLIEETRGLYLQRDYLWGNPGHHNAIPWKGFAGEREMRRFLRERLGITHVAINQRRTGSDLRPTGKEFWERTLWEAIHAGTLVPIHEANGFVLYAVGH